MKIGTLFWNINGHIFHQAWNYALVFIADSRRTQGSTEPRVHMRNKAHKHGMTCWAAQPLCELMELPPPHPTHPSVQHCSVLEKTSCITLDFIDLLENPSTSLFHSVLCSSVIHTYCFFLVFGLFIVCCKEHQRSIVKQGGKWQATILNSVCRRERAFLIEKQILFRQPAATWLSLFYEYCKDEYPRISSLKVVSPDTLTAFLIDVQRGCP